jgi:hypothetical protein
LTSDGESQHFLMCMEQVRNPPVLSSREQKRALGIPIYSPTPAVVTERIRESRRPASAKKVVPRGREGGGAETAPDGTQERHDDGEDHSVLTVNDTG